MELVQTHGTAMGTKVAVAFANISMAEIETKLIRQSKIKPVEWKRYIDDLFSLWNRSQQALAKQDIDLFNEQANMSYARHTDLLPSSCGIFVYKLVTSIDIRIVSWCISFFPHCSILNI